MPDSPAPPGAAPSELVPRAFAERIARRPADPLLAAAGGEAVSGEAWLARLPHLVEERLAAWNLTLDPDAPGAPWTGHGALVLPVRRHTLRPAVLKLTWPHLEARHEHLALRLWDGAGAVRLHAASPPDGALLLERLDADRPLTLEPVLDACVAVGGLLRALDRPATPQFDAVAVKAEHWDGTLAAPVAAVPRRLQVQARSHLRRLVDSAPEPRLVHEDLHDGNVLAPLPDDGPSGAAPDARRGHVARRGRWLAIDPKPVAGEGAYAVAPIVWNRPEVTAAAHNARIHVRLRADVVAEAAGLDEERVRAWTFVRLVLNAVDAAHEGPSADEWRARMIALAGHFAS